MSNPINLKDLSFIEDLDPGMAEMIYDVCVLNIDGMLKAINHPDNVDDKFLKQLSKDKLQEMVVFYGSMLDVFVEKERYEICANILTVVENLEKYSYKVATNQ
jgi:hypothetical protein